MSREFDFNIRKLVACYKPLPNPKPTFIFFQLNDCSRKEEMNIFNTVLYKNLGLGIKPGQDPHFFLFWQQYTFLFLFFFFFCCQEFSIDKSSLPPPTFNLLQTPVSCHEFYDWAVPQVDIQGPYTCSPSYYTTNDFH